ncbi:hypothetical protein, variant 1 [Batrachochytrium dendrobatidis JEL423]|uniref:ALA-interacting subunit n=1 Tax=Batrachochytrium dendrobatidis (strain JEL423) TaxID=403673 RepID=A0A177WLF0_BATDL|nr:hypothetical protein, variant 1 [Batrachochytrium dendrobatidis JEL423]
MSVATPTNTTATVVALESKKHDRSIFNKFNMLQWKLVLTRKTIMLICGAFALVLLPLGVVLYVASQQLNEVSFNYTQCALAATDTLAAPVSGISGTDSIVQWRYIPATKMCTVRFNVTTSMTSRVFLYIKITNMYQNHRLYLKSLDPGQLAGKVYMSAGDFPVGGETSCAFLQYANCSTASQYIWNGNSLSHADSNPDCLITPKPPVVINAHPNAQYYPCGLVANSMFSDWISNLTCIGSACRTSTFEFSESGISWSEDSSIYKPTGWVSDPTLQQQIPTMILPPPQWRKAWPDVWGNGYNSTNVPDISKWERLHVWMRKAGLPHFRKLWGRNNTSTLDQGIWEVSIVDNWDCRRFEGTKSLVFGQIGLMGSKNLFLGYAFLIMGCICALFTVLIGVYRPRYVLAKSL